MLVVGFPAGAFQANCYLVAADTGQDCVIIDPGQDAEQGIEKALREHRLNPVAVLATHGHFDHVFAAQNVADAHTIPVYIQPEDRVLLSDPFRGLGPQLAAMFGGQVQMREPRDVVELTEDTLSVAGFEFTVDHAPGHTPGSVIYRVRNEEGGQVAFTGDVLFAGSIGRTDLPGGDPEVMQRSLKEKVLTLSDDTVVLPGHMGATTIGKERASNPFLQS
ncbi:MBL fold metallo-hydrolase [Thermocrispum municipale]|uniref:MBL fold metallo-hydrolase n=1 Tax=Thermocrispum municipale TaxID=37926 RepID=UPI00048E4373|nr:MBL fold metallo-hydrolase [Thermocrispum municipale]